MNLLHQGDQLAALEVVPANDTAAVAVVIPCWNAAPWIARAIQSVLDQDYAEVEVIVIDDGSTDASLEAVKAFGDRIRWSSGPNRGACAARNAGLEMAQADWVLFLDADDYLEPGFVSAALAAGGDLAVDMIVGASKRERPGGSVIIDAYPPGWGSEDILPRWLGGRYVQTGAIVWRAEYLKSIGGWNPKVRRSQDIELVLRALLLGARAQTVDAGYCVWIDHASPLRIGSQSGRDAIESELDFHEELLTLIGPSRPSLRLPMATRFHALAEQAYFRGYGDLGDSAMQRSRQLGFDGRVGPWRKRITTRLIGSKGYAGIRRAKAHLLSRLKAFRAR